MQNKPELKKSVLVTGCSSGIGRTIALHLAQNGYTVFATVRKEADRHELCQLGEPNLVPLCPLDLAHLGDIAPLLDNVRAELQRRGQPGLFALVNSAGGGAVAPVELMDVDAFQRELSTRLAGPVALVQGCLPLLRQGGGRILWIMTPALIPTLYVTSIHACDFAANCLVRTLDIELSFRPKVPVVQIRCGGIKTPSSLKATPISEALRQHPRFELYRARLEQWSKEMTDFDQKRTEPLKVAQAVQAALEAVHPRRSYSVGHMARAAAFLEALPQPLADAILKMRF